MHYASTYYSFVLNITCLIKTRALHQASAASHILAAMGTYAQMRDEYFSHGIFFPPAYLDEEQVGYGVISRSDMAFNHTRHTALARLL